MIVTRSLSRDTMSSSVHEHELRQNGLKTSAVNKEYDELLEKLTKDSVVLDCWCEFGVSKLVALWCRIA